MIITEICQNNFILTNIYSIPKPIFSFCAYVDSNLLIFWYLNRFQTQFLKTNRTQHTTEECSLALQNHSARWLVNNLG